MNKVFLIVGGTALVASSAGAAVGYFLARHKLEAEYNERFDEEMSEALKAYERHNKEGRYSDPEELAAERLPKRSPKKPPMVDDSVYERPDVSDEDLARAVQHLKNYRGEDSETEEDWSNKVVTTPEVTGEDTATDRDLPYIISLEIWQAKEKDYHTPQLFYYKNNQVLTDSDGEVIGIEQHIGSIDNLKFGYMSNHERFVYIRNDELCCDFEVEMLEESHGG